MFELTSVTGPVTEPAAHVFDPKLVAEFVRSYRKFLAGAAWLNREYALRGWGPGRRTEDAAFETDIKEFEELVEKPLDELWKKLTPEEQTAALKEIPCKLSSILS